MLTQQRIVMEKNQAKIGKTFPVLIDTKSKGGKGYYIGRSQAEAPEVDGVVMVQGNHIRIGSLLKVRIVDYRDYDLIAKKV